MTGCYILSSGLSLKSKRSSSAARALSIILHGRDPIHILNIVVNDFIQGSTDAFVATDAKNCKVRVFLNMVAFWKLSRIASSRWRERAYSRRILHIAFFHTKERLNTIVVHVLYCHSHLPLVTLHIGRKKSHPTLLQSVWLQAYSTSHEMQNCRGRTHTFHRTIRFSNSIFEIWYATVRRWSPSLHPHVMLTLTSPYLSSHLNWSRQKHAAILLFLHESTLKQPKIRDQIFVLIVIQWGVRA